MYVLPVPRIVSWVEEIKRDGLESALITRMYFHGWITKEDILKAAPEYYSEALKVLQRLCKQGKVTEEEDFYHLA